AALLALLVGACDPVGLGKSNPNFLVVGHRGSPNVAAENTIPSFRVALSLGANAVETDVNITSDGTFVLWHDRNPDDPVALARQSGAEDLAFIPLVPKVGSTWRRRVDELTLAELRAHYGYGDVFGERSEIYRIPTLGEFFDWAASEPGLKHVYLDTKLGTDQKNELRALVQAVSERTTNDAGLANVSFTFLSVNRDLVLLLEDERQALALEQARVAWDYEKPGALAGTRRLGLRDISAGLTPSSTWSGFKDEIAEMVDAREQGSIDSVTVWTFDDEQKLAELLYYSVDAVMTNDSALLYSIWQDTLD
ncbi:MAG TPA: glycerophosphodiester phosphodiesterase family protein, partial [Polyangiaceae bacterium]